MGLLEFIIICAVVGLVVFVVFKLPIPAQIKTVILWSAVIVLVLILMSAMGLLGDVKIPRVR